ncbi:hypothetical protein JCM10207_004844 [Rhodosporidiobolus poonsookiae]
MLRLLQSATRALRATPTACTCLPSAPLPSLRSLSTLASPLRPHSSPVLRLAQSARAGPSPLQGTVPALALAPARPQQATQVRGYKMPACMRKKKSPTARNGGAGKTAMKRGARRAKRRNMRIKKIN